MSIYEIAFVFWSGVAMLGTGVAVGGGIANAVWRSARPRGVENRSRSPRSARSPVPVALFARNRALTPSRETFT